MNAFEEWANRNPDQARAQIERLRATGQPIPPVMEAWSTGRVYQAPQVLSTAGPYTPAQVGPAPRDPDIEAALDAALGPAAGMPTANLASDRYFGAQAPAPGLANAAQQMGGQDATLVAQGPAAQGVNPATTPTQDRLPMNPPPGAGEATTPWWLPGSQVRQMPNGEMVVQDRGFVGGEGMQAFNAGGRDTMLLGFDDELSGVFGGDTEAARLEKERLQQAFPGQFMAGQFVGATPSMLIPAGPLAGATGVAARVGGAALGAGLPMALYGAGTGTTAGERIAGAATMGTLGTGLGLAAPVVGSLAGKAVAGLVRRALPGGRSSAATRVVSEAFEADQGMPAGVTQLGPEGVVADVGPNTQQLAATVAAKPGVAQQAVRQFLTSRAGAAGSRVRADMAGAMPSANLPKTLQQLDTARANAARPLYTQAYATPINGQAPAFQAVLNTPAGKAAWRQASRLAANEGATIDKNALTTRAIDYVKRALDDQISAARSSGQSEQVRALEGLRTRLIKEIDAQNPAYQQARAAYAGPSVLMDAMEEGQTVFARTLSPDQLRVEMSRMSSAERDAFQIGARAQIEQIMGTARNDAAAAIRELAEKGWNAEKLRILLGRQGAAQILNALQRERTFAQTSASVMGNSETSRRLAGMAQLDKAATSMRAAYQNGGTLALLRAGGFSLLDKFLRGISGDQMERVTSEIAQQLTAQGPERDAILQALMQIRQGNATAGRVRSTVDQILRKAMQAGAVGTEGQTVGPATSAGQFIGNSALQLAQ